MILIRGGKSALWWEQKRQMSGGKSDKLGGGKSDKGKWTMTRYKYLTGFGIRVETCHAKTFPKNERKKIWKLLGRVWQIMPQPIKAKKYPEFSLLPLDLPQSKVDNSRFGEISILPSPPTLTLTVDLVD